MVEEGLNLAVANILPVEFDTKGNYRIKLVLVVNHCFCSYLNLNFIITYTENISVKGLIHDNKITQYFIIVFLECYHPCTSCTNRFARC